MLRGGVNFEYAQSTNNVLNALKPPFFLVAIKFSRAAISTELEVTSV
jgi:hypothetical protein